MLGKKASLEKAYHNYLQLIKTKNKKRRPSELGAAIFVLSGQRNKNASSLYP